MSRLLNRHASVVFAVFLLTTLPILGGGGACSEESPGQDAEVAPHSTDRDVSAEVGQGGEIDGGGSQASVPYFQRTFGGKWDDEGKAIAVANDGDLWVAGYTNSHGAGGWDGLLIRDDACGVPKRAWAYGGAGQDVFTGVVAMSNGDVTAIGRSDSFSGQSQVWVTRMNEQGAPVWSRVYGGPGHDAGVALAETDAGATVGIAETYNFGPGTPTFHNLMVLGIGSNGDLIWDHIYGGGLEGDAGFALDVQRDAQGSTKMIMIAGAAESYGEGRDDIWLLALNPTGERLWSKVYGGPEDDEARGIAAVPGGGWVLTGFTRGYGAASADIFAMQVDGQGELQWWHRYGGLGKDRGYGIHPWPIQDGGGYVITGYTESFGHPAGYDDRFVMRLDEVGSLKRLVTIGGKGDDKAVASVATGDGGVVLVGRTSSFGHGLRDVWLVKADGQGNALCNLQVQKGAELDDAEKDVTISIVLPGEATGAKSSVANIENVEILQPSKLTTTSCSACP